MEHSEGLTAKFQRLQHAGPTAAYILSSKPFEHGMSARPLLPDLSRESITHDTILDEALVECHEARVGTGERGLYIGEDVAPERPVTEINAPASRLKNS